MAVTPHNELYFPSSIVARMNRGEIRPFRNLAGLPYVRLLAPDKAGMPTLTAPIASREVKAWLADLYWHVRTKVPSAPEIELSIQILHNRSLNHREQCDAEAIDRELQQNPLATAITEYWDQKDPPPLDGRAKDVYENLRKFAIERGLLVQGGRHFPAGSNVLVRQLGLQHDFLKSLGVEFEIRRSNGSHIRIWRVDDAQDVSSIEPSTQSARNSEGFEAADDWRIGVPASEQVELADTAENIVGMDDGRAITSVEPSAPNAADTVESQPADDRTITEPFSEQVEAVGASNGFPTWKEARDA